MIKAIFSVWFLWTLFLVSIVVLVIEKLVKSLQAKIILYIIGGICIYFLPNGDSHLFMYPYFILGYYVSKNIERVMPIFQKYKYLGLIVWPVLVSFYQTRDYIFSSGLSLLASEYGFWEQLRIDIYRYVIGLAGCLFVVVLVELIAKYNQKVLSCFAEIGTFSLQIYVMQQIALTCVGRILMKIIIKFIGYNPFYINAIVFDMVISLLIAVSYCLLLTIISKKMLKYQKISAFLFGR